MRSGLYEYRQSDRLLTRRQAAMRLRVSTVTVDAWRRSGQLAAVLTGSQVRYRVADVDRARYRRDHRGWCPKCGYRFTAPGHRDECGPELFPAIAEVVAS